MLRFLTVVIAGCLTTELAAAPREHKVHNIVLYPEKNSWCNTTSIKHVVSFPGCQSVEIDNNVCVGACFSYSIPHTEPSDPGEVIVPYCDSCQPSETMWHNVTLDCNIAGEPQKTMLKRVQIITNCSCSPCESARRYSQTYDGDQSSRDYQDTSSSISEQQNLPELLNVMVQNNLDDESNTSKTEHDFKYTLNPKFVTLLKNMKDSKYDKTELRELLRLVEGSEHKLTDSSIADILDMYTAEHIDVNPTSLKALLLKFEHAEELREKHRHFGLGHHGKEVAESVDSNLGLTQGIEGSHLGMGHLKGSHVAMGLHNGRGNHVQVHQELDDSEVLDDILKNPGEKVVEINHVKLEDQSQGHHHVGENMGLGHLVKGPHGSLVLAPDAPGVREKLNVDPLELKANHAGTVVSYDSHATDNAKPLSN